MADDASSLDAVFAEDVCPFLADAMARGERAALVTLVGVDGGAPRGLGAQMGVSETGAACGYVSGGCVERAIVEEARAAIAAGACRTTRFGKGSDYLDIALPCGSAIDLYFDVKVARATVEGVRAAAAERRSCALVTNMTEGGAGRVSDVGGPTRREGGVFVRRYHPPVRLVIVGTGPIALYLARLATGCGLAVGLVTPDAATREMAAPFVARADALGRPDRPVTLDLDAFTAVAVVFHDHDYEPRVLEAALASEAFYIGALGSRRTHAARLETLAGMGVSAEQSARVRGPAGLSPRARSAPEIASSILAEILHDARAHLGALEASEAGGADAA